jgi:hypothetical protein
MPPIGHGTAAVGGRRGLLRVIARLNEADQGTRDAIRREREAVADLIGAAVVIPLRDSSPGQFLHTRSGLAQAQAQQGIQAQADAALPIRQDVRGRRLRGGFGEYLLQREQAVGSCVQVCGGEAGQAAGTIGAGLIEVRGDRR